LDRGIDDYIYMDLLKMQKAITSTQIPLVLTELKLAVCCFERSLQQHLLVIDKV
jgi:hypothetical protein